VNSECPPTLLIQGEHDVMAPVESTRTLYARLLKQKVPVIMHILPQTDHAFDLILPKISASAHNAIYDIERFLASRSKSFANNHVMSEENEDHQLHYA
jgi:acetyl esterase/lipase